MGLGSPPFSPIRLQNLTAWYLVLAFMAMKSFSHSSLSLSILSLESLMLASGSGRPWITRFSLLASLSRSSASITISILSCCPSVLLASSRSSLLSSSLSFLPSSMFALFSSTLASVSSCLLLKTFIWLFHFELKFTHDLHAQ